MMRINEAWGWFRRFALLTAASASLLMAADQTKEVVPSLKGLVFITQASELQVDGSSKLGIDTAAAPLLDAAGFQTEAARYLGRPATFDDLDAITRMVVAFYRERHHPLVEAVVPPQNVSSGVIQVLVTEFRVGEVRIEGNRWFSDEIIASAFSVKHGGNVDSVQLINELDAANTNPFRHVNLLYQPSSEPGYTDVVLQAQDRLPIRVSSGFDNNGTPVTGRNRWELGATWGNALWHDQQISYQLSTSTNFFSQPARGPGMPGGASFEGQSLTWTIPVRGRDSISFSGNYDRSVPNLGQDFGLVGKSWGISARYNLALHRTGSLIHTVSAGFDFRSTNNNLAFGGAEVMRNNTEIDQFVLGYSANLSDRWGSTALNTSLFFSPGNITPNNTDASFQPGYGQSGRELASAHYTYWRSDVTRLTKLPLHSVYALRLLGQTSTSNLLYTEQLAGGGPEIMRGYDPNSLLGDRGIILSNELRSPVLSRVGESSIGGVQAVAFWDYAHLSSIQNVADTVNHLSGSSTGLGLRYNFRANLIGKADYGWQLQHLPVADGRDHLVSFALLFAY